MRRGVWITTLAIIGLSGPLNAVVNTFTEDGSGNEFITTSGSTQTKRGGLNVRGALGVGMTTGTARADVLGDMNVWGKLRVGRLYTHGDLVRVIGSTVSAPWLEARSSITMRGVNYNPPSADGAGALTSDGSGNLSWAPASGGGTTLGFAVIYPSHTSTEFWNSTQTLRTDYLGLFSTTGVQFMNVRAATASMRTEYLTALSTTGTQFLNVRSATDSLKSEMDITKNFTSTTGLTIESLKVWINTAAAAIDLTRVSLTTGDQKLDALAIDTKTLYGFIQSTGIAGSSLKFAVSLDTPTILALLKSTAANLADDTGTINTAGNPVDWNKLKNVPAGIADGVDAEGSGGGGGAASLAVSTGSVEAAVQITSPTSTLNFSSPTFRVKLTGGSTAFVSLDPDTVTIQGDLRTPLGQRTQIWRWNGGFLLGDSNNVTAVDVVSQNAFASVTGTTATLTIAVGVPSQVFATNPSTFTEVRITSSVTMSPGTSFFHMSPGGKIFNQIGAPEWVILDSSAPDQAISSITLSSPYSNVIAYKIVANSSGTTEDCDIAVLAEQTTGYRTLRWNGPSTGVEVTTRTAAWMIFGGEVLNSTTSAYVELVIQNNEKSVKSGYYTATLDVETINGTPATQLLQLSGKRYDGKINYNWSSKMQTFQVRTHATNQTAVPYVPGNCGQFLNPSVFTLYGKFH